MQEKTKTCRKIWLIKTYTLTFLFLNWNVIICAAVYLLSKYWWTTRWVRLIFIDSFADFKRKLNRFIASNLQSWAFILAHSLYINLSPQKIDQILGFWASQNLKLSRSICFCEFKSSWAVNFHVAKHERVALSKIRTSTFCFSKIPIWQRPAWGIWI